MKADVIYRGFEPRMTRREASLILELPYVPRREYSCAYGRELTDSPLGNAAWTRRRCARSTAS